MKKFILAIAESYTAGLAPSLWVSALKAKNISDAKEQAATILNGLKITGELVTALEMEGMARYETVNFYGNPVALSITETS